MNSIPSSPNNSGAENEDQNQNPVQPDPQTKPEEGEEITLGTKVKVIVALMVVGVAVGVAYWVQTPTDLKTDVLDISAPAATDELAPAAIPDTEPATETPLEAMVANLPSANVQEVAIIDFSFEPAQLTITPGTTVVWTNMDGVAHTVSGNLFTSETLNSGDSFMYTFDQEGTFDYFCSIHPQMTGSLTVSANAAAVESGSDLLPVDNLINDTDTAVPTLYPAAAGGDTYEFPGSGAVAFDTLAASQTGGNLGMVEESALHAASLETPEKLVNSGPEDILYLGLFMVILYITSRRRFAAEA